MSKIKVSDEKMRELLWPASKGALRGPFYHPLNGETQCYCWMCREYKPMSQMGDVGCKACEEGSDERGLES